MPNIKQLIKDLTLEEKIELLSGFDAWQTNKIDRLGIPSIKMSDGPNGVRGDGNSGKTDEIPLFRNIIMGGKIFGFWGIFSGNFQKFRVFAEL